MPLSSFLVKLEMFSIGTTLFSSMKQYCPSNQMKGVNKNCASNYGFGPSTMLRFSPSPTIFLEPMKTLSGFMADPSTISYYVLSSEIQRVLLLHKH